MKQNKPLALIAIFAIATLAGCSQGENAQVPQDTTKAAATERTTTTAIWDTPETTEKMPDTSPIYCDTAEEAAVGALRAILDNDEEMFKRYAHKSDSELSKIYEDFLTILRDRDVEDYRRAYAVDEFIPYNFDTGLDDEFKYTFYGENYKIAVEVAINYDITLDQYFLNYASVEWGDKNKIYDGNCLEMALTDDKKSLILIGEKPEPISYEGDTVEEISEKILRAVLDEDGAAYLGYLLYSPSRAAGCRYSNVRGKYDEAVRELGADIPPLTFEDFTLKESTGRTLTGWEWRTTYRTEALIGKDGRGRCINAFFYFSKNEQSGQYYCGNVSFSVGRLD